MFNPKELVAYLRLNNISAANAEAIRSGLIRTGWSTDEIDSALAVLRASNVLSTVAPSAPAKIADPLTQKTQPQSAPSTAREMSSIASRQRTAPGSATARTSSADSVDSRMQRPLYSTRKLDSKSINYLLGVDVDIDDESGIDSRVLRTPHMSISDQFIALIIALLVSSGIILGAMYHYKVGLFHYSSEFATYLDL